MPRVSITMPTFNGARFLREALDSVFAQTWRDFELIVVIDGSTDGTEQILASYSDPRMRVIRNERNLGLPASLNVGLAAAKGEYWRWTSDDNVHKPETVARLVEYLETHPESAVVSTFITHMDETGRPTHTSTTDHNCFLCRTSSAREIGGYRTEYMLVEDADFFLRMIHRFGPIGRVREPLYFFRDHPSGLSASQIQKRQVVSARLHYDLITRSIEQGDLRALFRDRLSVAAFYRGEDAMQEIVAFAEQNMPQLAAELRACVRFLHSPLGRVVNRVRIAYITRRRRVTAWVKRVGIQSPKFKVQRSTL
jgi:glycosyltransferase involved in cell wall biosynthesis